MELALLADLRVASERARFGELFVLRGLCCDVAGLGRLAGLVGRERAAELLFTGEIIDARRALEIGLVSRVVPHAELLPEALDLARRIAANPPLAVRRLKAGLREALDPDWHGLGEWVSRSLAELFRTEDHREGVRAFLEKRPPRLLRGAVDALHELERRRPEHAAVVAAGRGACRSRDPSCGRRPRPCGRTR